MMPLLRSPHETLPAYLDTRYWGPQDKHDALPAESHETLPAYLDTRYWGPQDKHDALPAEPPIKTLPAYHGAVVPDPISPETRYLGPRDEQSARPAGPLEMTANGQPPSYLLHGAVILLGEAQEGEKTMDLMRVYLSPSLIPRVHDPPRSHL